MPRERKAPSAIRNSWKRSAGASSRAKDSCARSRRRFGRTSTPGRPTALRRSSRRRTVLSPSDALAPVAARTVRMLRTAMGPAIARLLDEPDVAEVMLNPDGRLWVDRLGTGLADTGCRLSAADGARIIQLVTHHVGAEAHGASPRVSAELPETGERFEGLLPPLVLGPTFAIRRPAVAVFSLDEYVATGIMTAADAAALRLAGGGRRKNPIVRRHSHGKAKLT